MSSMKNDPTWSTLIVSNLLLAIPVTFSFLVVAWLIGDWTASVICSNAAFFENGRGDELSYRNAFAFYGLGAGFLVSQICFALRFSRQRERPWPVIPFPLRVRLLSLFLAMLAAAGLLWFNLSPAVEDTETYTSFAKGWPLNYHLVYTYKQTDRRPPDPPYVNLRVSNAVMNGLICGDLVLILIVLAELFLSRHERRETRAIPVLASQPSTTSPPDPAAPVQPAAVTPVPRSGPA